MKPQFRKCIAVCENGHRFEDARTAVINKIKYFGMKVEGKAHHLFRVCPMCKRPLHEVPPRGTTNETVKM